MSPFSTDSTDLTGATAGVSEDSSKPAAGQSFPTTRSAARAGSTPSTAASLRRHAILADLSVLQVAALMGTGLLVALGVVLGGRSYITTVSPDGLVSAQPGSHGSSTGDQAAEDSSPAAM
ncbi:hypothetical protein [Actinomyces viscosus]|uniref:hypothetical protein n=1 Tax=Actinomyces viscosus TaxID=1656 RepID=UPI0028EB3986|nr:hypothetical protein [Actinomyces viscosus]